MTAKDRRMRLYERTRMAAASERNRRNMALWDRPDGAFRVFLGASYFSRALNVNIRDYYHDPEVYLETYLAVSLLAFEKFRDDAPVARCIIWHPGVVMEPSLFGVRALYAADKEPWEPHEYILKRPGDLAKLAEPDFFSNGAMRYMHRMYDELRELLTKEAPDFSVTFPPWRRSPFGVACCLRGMEQLCYDFYDDPGFVHDLMSFLTEARVRWNEARTAFTGSPDAVILGNDEVNSPTLSPGLYEEFVLPYERRLLEKQGPLAYFHSCGDLTSLIQLIKTLNPKMFQVSPWTNLEAACAAFAGTHTTFDIWAHVTDDVTGATPVQANTAMADRAQRCRQAGIYYQFNSGNIQAVGRTAEEDDENILKWADACRSIKQTYIKEL